MIKKILTTIGIFGAISGVFAKEAQTLPLAPQNPNNSEEDCINYSEPNCDTYVIEKEREIRALYAVPDIRDEKPIKNEDILEKYGIPEEERYDKPVLKYGIPEDRINKKIYKERTYVVKYGIPGSF